jgi:hypothetical protein
MWTSYINESQNLLNRNGRGFIIAFIFALYLAVFSPLWFTGFMLQQKLFSGLKGANQILCIGCFSLALYCLLWLLKGVAVVCMNRGKIGIWLPLFLILNGFACIAPTIAVFQGIGGTKHPAASIPLSLLIGGLTFLHYQFHAEGAPKLGLLPYKVGCFMTAKILAK